MYKYKQQAPKPLNRFQKKNARRKSSPLPDAATILLDRAAIRRQSVAQIYTGNGHKCPTSLVPKGAARWPQLQSSTVIELCGKRRSTSMGSFQTVVKQKKSLSFTDILHEVTEL